MTASEHKAKSEDGSRQGGLQEVHEARRKYPRLILNRPGTIKKLDEEIIEVTIHDISIDGLQVRCDHRVAKRLYPSGTFIQPGKGPMVQIKFHLPLPEKSRKVVATCQIFYVAGVEKNLIAFGLQFRKFKGDCGEHVDHFIMHQIEPVEDRMRNYLETPRSNQEISEFMQMEIGEVMEVLERLKGRGEVVSYQDGSICRNLKSSAVQGVIFEALGALSMRLGELERRLDRK